MIFTCLLSFEKLLKNCAISSEIRPAARGGFAEVSYIPWQADVTMSMSIEGNLQFGYLVFGPT